MKKTKVLNKLPFIYKNGLQYRFSAYMIGDYKSKNECDHEIILEERKELILNFYLFKKTYIWYKRVKSSNDIIVSGIGIYETDESITRRTLSHIRAILEDIELKKNPPKSNIEIAFENFDGYLDVKHEDKIKYERLNTIKDIVNDGN